MDNLIKWNRYVRIGAILLLSILVLRTSLYAQSSISTLDPGKQISQYVLDHWTTENGLPQNSITAIIQSNNGYLWFGTEEGLVRFNGNSFTTFDKSNTLEFEADGITSLAETANNTLWVGTRGGGLLKRSDGQFSLFSSEQGLSSQDITTLYTDSNGALWIGTYGGGLMKLQSNTLVYYNEENGISGQFISEITQDQEDRVWVGTEKGLFYFNGTAFTRYEQEPVNSSFISALFVDSSQKLWIGTADGDLFVIDNDQLTKLETNFLSRSFISSIIEDNLGALWFGLNRGGIARYYQDKFEYSNHEEHESPLSQGEVLTLLQDKEGSLWIGHQATGLHRIRNEQFTPVGTFEGLSNNKAMSLAESPGGDMWIGTSSGLNLLKNNQPTSFKHQEKFDGLHILAVAVNGDSVWVGTMEKGLFLLTNDTISSFTVNEGLPSNSVFGLNFDSVGRLWIATDTGVAIYKNAEFTILDQEDGLPSNYITSFIEDQDGAIWIGTYDAGLSKYQNDSITSFSTEEGLSNNIILSLHLDRSGVLWIGTYGGGLNRYENGKITTYTTREGLFNDNLYSILEDDHGYLWFSCNKGIFKVSKNELNQMARGQLDRISSVVYNKQNGLRNQEANGGFQPSAWKATNGTLWFPTLGGVVFTDPTRKYNNQIKPPVHIEKMYVNEMAFPMNGANIELEAGAKKIQFKYAALSYSIPKQVRYKYILEGVDETWSHETHDHVATYTNIPPGTYTFKVIASNNSGVWNETGASLEFVHRPFFYQTIWFKLLVGFTLIGIGASIFRVRIIQLKRRQEELEQMVEERTRDLRLEKEKTEEAKEIIQSQAEKLIELDRFKTRFFANISHEFRTPLTMIIGPLENTLSGFYGELEEGLMRQISIMLRNAQRLLRLINQLLDLSKLEAGKMELQTSERNMIPFLENILLSCTPMAENKDISLNFSSELTEIKAYYEPDKMEKVFFNLLSNALKFTPGGGTISMVINKRDASEAYQAGAIEIRVRDTGKGIPPSDLPYIFDRFHQVSGSNSRDHEGTGIGLALVRELILLHKGDITVESEIDKGTEFMIVIPLGNTHLSEDQINSTDKQEVFAGATVMSELAAEGIAFDHETPVQQPTDNGQNHSLSQSLVLVVDDNEDILEYVAAILSSKYLIEVASDGVDGLEKAKLLKPDLILSDLMMPRMSGNDFCKEVKADPDLNHIPFILMTARATNELKIEGLEMGVDDYIAKPFNARELLARIGNLLQLRENQKELKVLNKTLEKKVEEQLKIILNDRIAYEAEILEAKEKAEASSRLKSIILDNVNHEFRTPIAGIIGSAEILEMEVDEEMNEFVGFIKSNTQRLQNTLDAVIELSSLESDQIKLKQTRLNPSLVLKDLQTRYELLAASKGLTMDLELPEEPVSINVDEFAFARILDHLIDNALKFTKEGAIHIRLESRDSQVHIHFTDTGIGISKEFMPKLFDAFVQESDGTSRAYEGVGIGLSISKKLAEMMDGTLTAKSVKGEGTTMTLAFPQITVDTHSFSDQT